MLNALGELLPKESGGEVGNTGQPGGGPELWGTKAAGVKEVGVKGWLPGLRELLEEKELNTEDEVLSPILIAEIPEIGLWLLGRTGEGVVPNPIGVVPNPMGVVPNPMGVVVTPMGVVDTPMGVVTEALLLKR